MGVQPRSLVPELEPVCETLDQVLGSPVVVPNLGYPLTQLFWINWCYHILQVLVVMEL